MSRRATFAGVFHFVALALFTLLVPFPAGRPAALPAVATLICVVMLARLAAYRVQVRVGADPAWFGRFRVLHRVTAMTLGLAWGALSASTIRAYGLGPPSLVTLVIVSGIAGNSVYMGLDLAMSRMLAVVIIGQPALALLVDRSGDPAARSTGLMCITYIAYLWVLARQTHALYWETARNRELVRTQRDQLGAVLEAVPGFVFWLTRDLRYVGANERYARILGVPVAEIAGQPLGFRAPDHPLVPRLRRFLDSSLEEEIYETRAHGVPGVVPVDAGEPHTFLLALRKYATEGGSQVVVVGLDVEDRKRAERELEAARASAVEASRLAALGVMAAGIAHEVNNPMQALHYGMTLLRGRLRSPDLTLEALSADVAKVCERGERMIDRIARIIASLRSFARDGRRDPMEAIDLRQPVAEILELCQSRAAKAGIRLELVGDGAPLVAHGRRTQIGQVLVNLLDNAFDAVDGHEDPRVRIELSARAGAAEIAVIDNGSGVSEELRGRIMEPFFTTKPVGKGTGLGLSISRSIAEDHGGSLRLEGGPETRFVLRLRTVT